LSAHGPEPLSPRTRGERHATTREDLPSSATLRNRLGRWSAITTRLAAEQALAVHAQRAGQLSPLAELGARS